MKLSEEQLDWFLEVARNLGRQDEPSSLPAEAFLLDGQLVTFNRSMTAGAEHHVLVQVPVGWLPKDSAPVLRRVLELQMLLTGPCAPQFGIAMHSDVLTASLSIDPEAVEPDSAAGMVATLAMFVKRLRESLVIEDHAPAAPAALADASN